MGLTFIMVKPLLLRTAQVLIVEVLMTHIETPFIITAIQMVKDIMLGGVRGKPDSGA